MISPIVRPDALPLQTQRHGDTFEASMAAIAAPLGARHLGARYVEVPAGKKAWPFHCHHANDEMFVILSGSGTLRYGCDEHAVIAGDVSSMREPDVMQYPDSGKLAVFAGSAPGGDKAARRLDLVLRGDATAGYWDGED